MCNFLDSVMKFRFLNIFLILSVTVSGQLIPVIETYENGNIKNINYHRKRASGIDKVKLEEYFENGFKKEQGPFKNGQKNGKWFYWYENGEKRSEGVYKNGVKDGFWIGWYENGQKQGEVTWKEGREQGLWIIWYPNGQKNKEYIWKNGKKNGPFIKK